MNVRARPSDKTRFQALLAKLAKLGFKPIHDTESGWSTAAVDYDEPPRAISLEDFFTGNPNNGATFAANLPEHPGEDFFNVLLHQIRDWEDVADVLIGVTRLEFNGGMDDWAYADSVYIITVAPPEAISPEAAAIQRDEDPPNLGRGWFGKYFPDEIKHITYDDAHARCGLPRPPDGYHAYLLWWD